MATLQRNRADHVCLVFLRVADDRESRKEYRMASIFRGSTKYQRTRSYFRVSVSLVQPCFF